MPFKFFAYDPDGGLEFFATEREAIEFANDIIEVYRDESGDGWDEVVGNVCWGEIKQRAAMCNITPAPEGSDFDFQCDYQLTNI